jgi:hypothetical protein
MEIVKKLHGIPGIIVGDREPFFAGIFLIKLFSCLGNQLARKSSYHPQSYEKIEIVNKCLKGRLHCFASAKHTH